MAKTMIKKIITFTTILTIIISLIATVNLSVYAAEKNVVDSFYVIDEDGNINVITRTKKDLDEVKNEIKNKTYTVKANLGDVSEIVGEYNTVEEAMDCYNETIDFFNEINMFTGNQQTPDVEVSTGDDVVATTAQVYGVVRFNRSKSTITYTEVKTGNSSYISPASTGDAAYLKTEGDYVYAKVAGVDIKVKASDVSSIVSYKNNTISSYYTKNGYLYHKYAYYSGSSVATESTKVGYKPSYMDVNVTYYSYDGHYFYDTFEKMIDDYLKGTYDNAINKDNPHYNYYQYISFHTKANYTASDYNSHVASKNKPTSVIKNAGSYYVDVQNKYTINSLLMFGVSINESGWGTSNLSVNKNNIFGLNAVDSNPYESGNKFSSVKACIDDFAYGWISAGYLDGTDSRYRGPHLGDKNSGINIKYASDPYWGEKAAARGYAAGLEDDDYGRYSIAIAQKIVNLYKEPSTSSKVIYTSSTSNDKVICDYPLTVLDKVTVDGEEFYKVRSDMPLKEDRSGRDVEAIYEASRDYVYVKASDVKLVFEGTGKDIYDSDKPIVPETPEVPEVPENPEVPEVPEKPVEPEVPEVPDEPEKPVEPEIPVVPEKTQDEVLAATKLTHSGGYLTGFKLGANISETIKSITDLDERIVVTVKDKDGNTKTSATVTTSMTITVKTNNTEKTYTCVIYGDTNCDGSINSADLLKTVKYLKGTTEINILAADVTKDGLINSADLLKTVKYLKGTTTIDFK